jgi:glutamate:GABA antiporter
VTSVRPVELSPDGAVASRSRAERSKLRRELGRLDAVCLLIAAIVVLDTLGAVARGGAQTLTWLAIVAALFFVPAGLVIAELGSAFPNQGGPYVWTRLAFGRYAGSLVALVYFVETPVWVGGSAAITAVAVVDRLLVPLAGGWRVAVALAVVWAAVALALAPLRVAKLVPRVGAAAQVGLLGFFTVTVAVYAAGHGVHGLAAGDLAPSWAVFVLVAPVLVYNFLGFELPSAAGEELVDPARDVPASIARAGALTCALYAVPVLAIVLVVPADRITGLTGFIDALASVFVVYGPWEGLVGGLAGLAFLWILVANGLTWVMASSRTQAAASLDGAGPPALGRIAARTGTPVPATLAVLAVATATTLAAFAVSGGSNSRYFSAALTLSVALLALANLIVFPALVRLRRSHPDRPRAFRVPGGPAGALAASALATGWSAVALAAALWPGLGTGDPDAHLPDGFAGQRLAFTLTELLPLAAVLAAAFLLTRGGRRREPAWSAADAVAHEPGDLGHHRGGAEDPAVAEAGGGDQPGVGPGLGDGRAVRPAGLGVLAVVDEQQRRGGDLVGHGGHVKGGHGGADPALDPGHQAGADPLAEAEAAGEGPGVGQRVGHGGDERQAADGEAGAHGVGGGRGPERVGDHRVGRAVGGHHRGQGVGELEDGAAAGPFRAGVGDAVAGGVEGDHPEAGLDQGGGEGVQLPAPPAPAMDQVDGRGVGPIGRAAGGSFAPDLAGDRPAVEPHLEHAAGGRLPVVAAAPAGDGEPERLRPAGSGGGGDPLEHGE